MSGGSASLPLWPRGSSGGGEGGDSREDGRRGGTRGGGVGGRRGGAAIPFPPPPPLQLSPLSAPMRAETRLAPSPTSCAGTMEGRGGVRARPPPACARTSTRGCTHWATVLPLPSPPLSPLRLHFGRHCSASQRCTAVFCAHAGGRLLSSGESDAHLRRGCEGSHSSGLPVGPTLAYPPSPLQSPPVLLSVGLCGRWGSSERAELNATSGLAGQWARTPSQGPLCCALSVSVGRRLWFVAELIGSSPSSCGLRTFPAVWKSCALSAGGLVHTPSPGPSTLHSPQSTLSPLRRLSPAPPAVFLCPLAGGFSDFSNAVGAGHRQWPLAPSGRCVPMGSGSAWSEASEWCCRCRPCSSFNITPGAGAP